MTQQMEYLYMKVRSDNEDIAYEQAQQIKLLQSMLKESRLENARMLANIQRAVKYDSFASILPYVKETNATFVDPLAIVKASA